MRVIVLPLIRRELSIAARRTPTFRQRVLYAAVALGTAMLMTTTASRTALPGAMMFQVLAWAGFAICLLEGVRATADSIAMERREGTLGLLLLTDLRGPHVVTGKFLAACIQAVPTVLAMLPVFALPLLFGGVTGGECVRLMLTFLATLLLTLAAGTFVSASTTASFAAFLNAAGLLCVLLGLPVSLATWIHPSGAAEWRWLAGPLEMFLRVPDASYDAAAFAVGAAISVFLSATFFALAAWVLHRKPRLEPAHTENWLQRWLRPRPGRIDAWGGASATTSPAVWLAERTLPGRNVLWTLTGIGMAFCFCAGFFGGDMGIPLMLGCQVFFGFLIKMWAAAVAAESLNAARRSGALELMLCTPMPAAAFVQGQVDAFYSYFFVPAAVTAFGFNIAGLTGHLLGADTIANDPSFLIFGFAWFFTFLIDLFALAYVGLWFGLTTARVDRAIGKTVFAVLIVPWLTLVIPLVGCFGILAWPAFWVSWANKRLVTRLRTEAARQFSAGSDESWLPWSSTDTAPDLPRPLPSEQA